MNELESLYKRIHELESFIRWLMVLSIPPKYAKVAVKRCEDLGINLVELNERGEI